MGHVPLSDLIRKLTSLPSSPSLPPSSLAARLLVTEGEGGREGGREVETLGELRELVLGMYGAYLYELKMKEIGARMMTTSLYGLVREGRRRKGSGVRVRGVEGKGGLAWEAEGGGREDEEGGRIDRWKGRGMRVDGEGWARFVTEKGEVIESPWGSEGGRGGREGVW